MEKPAFISSDTLHINTMNKHFIFGVLTFCGVLQCLSKSIIGPFFPPFAKDRGISDTIIGLIIACNPVGSVLASLILGKIISKDNRNKFMILGLLIQMIGTFMFAATYYLGEDYLIVIVSIAARIISGIV